jgi:hypothetical protein
MHPTKTRIVYCWDGKRRGKYPNVKFGFLGYCFRPRLVRRSRDNAMFCSFAPAVSPSALKPMRAKIREFRFRRRTELALAEIANRINPLLRGWINYYRRYAPSALAPCPDTLTRRYWLGRGGSSNGSQPIRFASAAFCKSYPGKTRICSCIGSLARPVRLPDGSRMTRECHARF